jgi:PST family polysaccharide transporter
MSVDLLLVEGIVADDTTTGRYAAAQNLARITYFLLLPAGAVLFPAVATTVAGADPSRLRTVVADGIEGAAALAVPVCAVVAGAGDELLQLVFGSAYAGAGDVLLLLGPALGLLSVAATLGAVIRGAGHGRSPMLVALAALACGLVAGVPLTAAFDARGAAAATLLSATLCLAGQGALVARLVGSFLDLRRLAIVVAAGAACFAVAAQASSPLAAVPIVPAALLLDAALVVAFRAVPRVLRRAGA